jgi:hypothetical protein
MEARDRQALIDVRCMFDQALDYLNDSEVKYLAKDYLKNTVIRCLVMC